MQPSIEEKLRKKYMYHPSKGMTPENIRSMSGEALLDMDYFLNDDDWTTISEKMDSISSNFRTVYLLSPILPSTPQWLPLIASLNFSTIKSISESLR